MLNLAMQKNKTLAIILSLLIPGLGNMVVNQTKKGLYLLIGTIALTFFYFLPLGFVFLPVEYWTTFWIITGIMAAIAFVLDVALMVVSIYWIVSES